MNIDTIKMSNVLKLLQEYFITENINNIAKVEFPKKIKYKSSEWLYYIFYSCLLDYGMRSKVYHKNLINTYNKYPNIFNPKYVVANYSNDSTGLNKIIKENIHPRYPNVALNKWLELSYILIQYDNLLEQIKSFKVFNELNLFIKNIHGYGQKTGGLLLRLIYESNICDFVDEMNTIPLDRHDIEITYLTDIIQIKKLNETQILKLSNEYIKCARLLNIKPNILDKYLWEVGNKFCNTKKCEQCPLSSECKKLK